MIDVRCKNCNRLLMKANMVVAAVKCPSCKMIFEYKLLSNLHLTNSIDPNTLYAKMSVETEESRPD